MINIINTASDGMITGTTVDGVGLCYYNYETEEILELSSIAINSCSVSPMSPIIKKYYMIAETAFSYVNISISATAIDARYFSAKMIVNEVTPNKNDFDDLTEFNMAVVGNPLVNHLIPVWILIEPKISANIDISMAINIEAA